MGELQGKHIVLGVTGGIAAYKSANLIRLLVKEGAEVQVIMTPNAKEFITPLTLATLSRNPVISEFFTANTGEWHSHVDLGIWADCMIVAPATASTIAKMANGVADNMLITSYLSARSKVFVAPAMDLDMFCHPTTQSNIQRLRSFGNTIIEPAEGELASGLVGKGRMAEPEEILKEVCSYFRSEQLLAGKRIMITAGPTFERIDPVRFIGNFSSGKMGYALAEAAASFGAEVCLVSGPVGLTISNSSVKVFNVESAEQMKEKCLELFPEMDITIMAAAVADYRPVEKADRKIKREKTELITLELVKNPDIIASLGEIKRKGQKLVGFALETDNELANAKEKLRRKNLDMIVLNSLNDKGAGFGTDTNRVTVIYADGEQKTFPLMSKKELAFELMLLMA